jgi:signal transduction histidine kinase
MRPSAEEETAFPPASVLVVDDTPASLLAFSAVLEPLGHRVVTARSGLEAIERAESEPFAVMVTDVQMPGLDGLETAARLRRSPRAGDLPIIFVSATHDDPRTIKRAYDLGAIDYLEKPVEPEILCAKVAALVSLYRRGQELKRRAEIIAAKGREAAEALAAHQRAEAASRLKDRYIGILGHDLRTPLTVITMSAQRLIKRPDAPEVVRDAPARILGAADRMTTMINDLIDFTRGQLGGGIPIFPVAGDFGEICRAVVDELKVVHPGRAFVLDLAGDLEGRWDVARVQQAVSNLVGNAVFHGTGPVTVRAAGEPAAVLLAVHNFGAPIPPEEIPTIFEPFRKGERRSSGLGLGLYIVREIVRGHGGLIDVQSTADAGTTFRARWPRSPAAAGDPGPPDPAWA